jgi:hypothetical protein
MAQMTTRRLPLWLFIMFLTPSCGEKAIIPNCFLSLLLSKMHSWSYCYCISGNSRMTGKDRQRVVQNID